MASTPLPSIFQIRDQAVLLAWDDELGALVPVKLANNRLDVNAGLVGDPSICCLLSDTSAPGANDVLTSTTGFKGFEALIAGPLAAVGTDPANAEMVAVAWSTTANDHAGVAALLATAVDEFDGGPSTPPVLIPNCKILRDVNDVVGAVWDGTTRIKTIGVRQVGDAVGSSTVTVLLNVVV